MLFLINSVWILSLFTGFCIYKSCYRASSLNYFLLNVLLSILLLFMNLEFKLTNNFNIFFLCTPIAIGLLKIFIDSTLENRLYEKNLHKMILFLEIVNTKIKFGRSFLDSLAESHYLITRNTHVNFLLKENVVLQQPKSRFFKVFHLLEKDLNAINIQKIGQKDLINHIKRKYENRLCLHRKTKIALSQYHSQSIVVLCFWLLAVFFLCSQGLFFKYFITFLISLTLMCLGVFVSKKLLISNNFRT